MSQKRNQKQMLKSKSLTETKHVFSFNEEVNENIDQIHPLRRKSLFSIPLFSPLRRRSILNSPKKSSSLDNSPGGVSPRAKKDHTIFFPSSPSQILKESKCSRQHSVFDGEVISSPRLSEKKIRVYKILASGVIVGPPPFQS